MLKKKAAGVKVLDFLILHECKKNMKNFNMEVTVRNSNKNESEMVRDPKIELYSNEHVNKFFLCINLS